MQLRSSLKKLKTEHAHSPAKKSRRRYREGCDLEAQTYYVEAYTKYHEAIDLMSQVRLVEREREDLIYMMRVFSRALDLVEDGLLTYEPIPGDTRGDHQARVVRATTEKIKLISSKVLELYEAAPAITDIDYKIMAARALLASNGCRWFDRVSTNAVVPDQLPEHFDKVEALLVQVCRELDEIGNDDGNFDERLLEVMRCYAMMGNGYLRLADVKQAVHYYMHGVEKSLAMIVKGDVYFDFLSVVFHQLHTQLIADECYAVVSFARRLFDNTGAYQVDFAEFAVHMLEAENQLCMASPMKKMLLRSFLAVIRERVDAGAFGQEAGQSVLPVFPNNNFREAMRQPYYQQRFKKICYAFSSYGSVLEPSVTPPPALATANDELGDIHADVKLKRDDSFSFLWGNSLLFSQPAWEPDAIAEVAPGFRK